MGELLVYRRVDLTTAKLSDTTPTSRAWKLLPGVISMLPGLGTAGNLDHL